MWTNHTSAWEGVPSNRIHEWHQPNNCQFQYSAHRWVEFPYRVQQRDDSISGCPELFIEVRSCPPVCACGRGKPVVHFLKGDLFLIHRLSLYKYYSDSVNSLNGVSWICSASAAGTFLQLFCVKLNLTAFWFTGSNKGFTALCKTIRGCL